MEWIVNSYDRRTDRDGQNRFTTEAAFIAAGQDLLRDVWRGFVSAILPDGTVVKDVGALRAIIDPAALSLRDRRATAGIRSSTIGRRFMQLGAPSDCGRLENQIDAAIAARLGVNWGNARAEPAFVLKAAKSECPDGRTRPPRRRSERSQQPSCRLPLRSSSSPTRAS
jgi:hypothetical protein